MEEDGGDGGGGGGRVMEEEEEGQWRRIGVMEEERKSVKGRLMCYKNA